MAATAGPYQSLYRRYRPQRFEEVRGQDHVTTALRNAVREGRTTHAYLFSGPRGTGKTSTARILAKALNCLDLQDGEPCGVCASCVQVQEGTSLDTNELDAASNNGVDAMRDLVNRAALGSPGRWKVYIIDEVHMLSAAASNALLKTLEEPPGHVVFVLATTDPQKVLPTIRSRTQHYEFRLLPADVLNGLVHDIAGDAGIDVGPEALAHVARRGAGSARDALSALDQVAALGGVHEEAEAADALVEALCDRDAGAALVAVADACAAGRDARRIATELFEHLRNCFLAAVAPSVAPLSDEARDVAAGQAQRLGTPAVVRAIEVLGQAQIDMRDAIDPRACMEVALVRLATPETDTSPAALVERLERLERQLARGATAAGSSAAEPRAVVPPPSPSTGASPGPSSAPAAAPQAANSAPASGAGAARAALGAVRKAAGRPAPSAAPPPVTPPPVTGASTAAAATVPSAPPAAAPSPVAPPEPSGSVPDRDALTLAWGDTILAGLSAGARSRFSAGRFVGVEKGTALFGLPNKPTVTACESRRPEVEEALAKHFGTRIPIKLVVDETGPAAAAHDDQIDEPLPDIRELEDAPAAVASPEGRLLEAFPGAEEVES